MAGERIAAAMSFAAVGLAGTMEIQTKLQMARRISYSEHKTRQTDGSLMVSDASLINMSSPVIGFTTRDFDPTMLAGADKQAVTTAVFSQPAVGLAGVSTKITATFTAGIVFKGDLVGGDDPATEAEQAMIFVSTIGEPTWAEAA